MTPVKVRNIVIGEGMPKICVPIVGVTKADIIAEIQGRENERINAMKSELEKKSAEHLRLDNLVKEQRIYISSNYEAYLGKEYVTMERLTELKQIMTTGAADTVAQALAVYKEKHQ